MTELFCDSAPLRYGSRSHAPREAVESSLVRQWVCGTGRSTRERDVIVAAGK